MKPLLMSLCALTMLGAACSNDDDKVAKQKECDGKAADIAKAAAQYNVATEGVCNNPSVTPQFAAACADLKQCNAELAKM